MRENEIKSAGKITLGEIVKKLSTRTDTGNAVDGGAGSGSTAKEIISGLTPGRSLLAYEPFVGNHRFWGNQNHNIELRKRALSSFNGEGSLRVSSTVSAESTWGKEKDMVGYSSVGYLANGSKSRPLDYAVSVVRGDDDLVGDEPIGVVKLDLQGGEKDAIEGMQTILRSSVKLVWIEMLASNTELVELMNNFGLVIADTEYLYLFRGEPSSESLRHFNVTSGIFKLSTDEKAWKGTPIKKWEDFPAQIEEYRSRFGLIQTDLIGLTPSLKSLF